jgi:hypothetical protein
MTGHYKALETIAALANVLTVNAVVIESSPFYPTSLAFHTSI